MREERRDMLRRLASIDRAATATTLSLRLTPDEEFRAGFDAGWKAAMAQENISTAPSGDTP